MWNIVKICKNVKLCEYNNIWKRNWGFVKILNNVHMKIRQCKYKILRIYEYENNVKMWNNV